jgi:hypothetical protein
VAGFTSSVVVYLGADVVRVVINRMMTSTISDEGEGVCLGDFISDLNFGSNSTLRIKRAPDEWLTFPTTSITRE